MSGSCASRTTGASSATWASVPGRSSTPPLRAGAPEARASPECQLVAQPRQPEALTVLAEPHRVVLEHRNADALERAPRDGRAAPGALNRQIIPPVMVAEDCVYAERRDKTGERRSPILRIHLAGEPGMAGDVVAE